MVLWCGKVYKVITLIIVGVIDSTHLVSGSKLLLSLQMSLTFKINIYGLIHNSLFYCRDLTFYCHGLTAVCATMDSL
jgi:hypothetical protein